MIRVRQPYFAQNKYGFSEYRRPTAVSAVFPIHPPISVKHRQRLLSEALFLSPIITHSKVFTEPP